jgi:hypothetical protein
MKVNSTRTYDEARRKEYMPLEDQIDEIVKCLKHLSANGIDIGSDVQAVISHRDSIKSKHQKP